jgi:endonuclease/exonuclease/phosphatase family metal-dependent hydrolase
MRVTVGTFNLNNLFSRYNFLGEIDELAVEDPDLESTVSYEFTDTEAYRIRTYKGKLVEEKPPEERAKVANRIIAMNADVLAVQEIEDIDRLRLFARDDLGGLYPYQVLVEGNDPRLIDVGVLSKLPIGGITSWQEAVHDDSPDDTVFGRDLLQVEIYDPPRNKKLLTLFNNHLKSHYVPWDQDPVVGAQLANERRKRQAEKITEIVEATMRPDSRYVILGDMNDPPDSEWLAPFAAAPGLGVVDALTNPIETIPAREDDPPPQSPAWTHRFKPSGEPAQYELYDQIWLSPRAGREAEGRVDRQADQARRRRERPRSGVDRAGALAARAPGRQLADAAAAVVESTRGRYPFS